MDYKVHSEYESIQLHSKIKKIRELRNLTIKEMAFDLNITPRAYSYIENGRIQITVKRLFEICNLLNCSLFDLINFNPETCFKLI